MTATPTGAQRAAVADIPTGALKALAAERVAADAAALYQRHRGRLNVSKRATAGNRAKAAEHRHDAAVRKGMAKAKGGRATQNGRFERQAAANHLRAARAAERRAGDR